MNIAKLKHEIYNSKLLLNCFTHFGFHVGFWSLADGVIRRVGLKKVYEKTHYKRYEACKKYLRNNYSYVVEKYKNKKIYINDMNTINESSPIWRFWYQGEAFVPYPVNICIDSVKRNANKHPVIFIDKYNYSNYVKLPLFMEEKIEKGIISIAHLSDILRVCLLKEYGGIWLDSTFYLNRKLPNEINNYKFYSICAGNTRKWVVSKDLWSLGMLASGKDNEFIQYCWEFLYEYWKKEDSIIAYLILDCIISIGYEEIKEFRSLINDVPNNNYNTFALLEKQRNEAISEIDFQRLISSTYFFQLTYKLNYLETNNNKQTLFGRLISHDEK